MMTSDGLSRVLYLPHGGGPLPLLGEKGHEPLIRFLREIPAQLGDPHAILLISAHWECARPTLTGGAAPALIYDYYGFPPESYAVEYAAPGAPDLAARIQGLLGEHQIGADIDASRGFDHGLFVPLKLMYPAASLPCLQLSLVAGLDPQTHIAIGKALAPLRREGVLIVGSGLSFHNLRIMLSNGRSDPAQGMEFDRWLNTTCTAADLSPAEREQRLLQWQQAPHARHCHPREEHLLPLHVCYGAASDATPRAENVFNDRLMGQQVSGLLW